MKRFLNLILLIMGINLYPRIVVVKWANDNFSKKVEEGIKSVLIPDEIHNLKRNKGKAGTLFRDYSNVKNTALIVIGEEAIKLSAKWINKTPVVYCGIVDKTIIKGKTNFTGIDMITNLSKQLGYIKQGLPEVKKIGLVFNAEKSLALVKGIENKSSNYGLSIEKITVEKAGDIGSALHFLQDIDAILLIPDPIIANITALKIIMLNEFKSKIPVIGFLSEQISGGAVLGYVADLNSIGKKAANMAKSILNNGDMVPPSHPDGYLSINLKTAQKIGINFEENFVKKAKEVTR